MLTDRYLGGIPEDSRAAQDHFLKQDFISDENMARVKALNEIAARRGQALAQMAIAWVLRDPRVTSRADRRVVASSSSRPTSPRSTTSSSPTRSWPRSTSTRSTPGSTSGSSRARREAPRDHPAVHPDLAAGAAARDRADARSRTAGRSSSCRTGRSSRRWTTSSTAARSRSLIDTAGMAATWSDDAEPESLRGRDGDAERQLRRRRPRAGPDRGGVVSKRGRSIVFSDVRVTEPDGRLVATGSVVQRFGS